MQGTKLFRVEKNRNYTTMSNYHLRDKNLSYKAKGLLSFMLSLPDTWDYSMNGLVSVSKENIGAVRTILHELEENKYLLRTRYQNNKGQFQYEYAIYEYPYTENPYTVIPNTKNHTQINTNIINTKKQIDKDDKTKISSFFVAEEHNRLTLVLIERGYMNEDDIQIFYYDKLFNKLLEEDNSYQDLIQIIHYIVPRVVKGDFRDEDGNIIENKFGYFKNLIISNIHRLNLDIDDLWGDDDLDSFYNFDDMYSDAQLQK